MNYLALDTALGVKIILSVDGKYYEYTDEEYKMASSVLLPKIDELLSQANISLEDIDIFATTIGPGSFTGIRIAVNTIRAFAYALNKPVIALDCLTVGAFAYNGACSSILYGWGDNYYMASFDNNYNMIGDAKAVKQDELSSISGVVVCDKITAETIDSAIVYDSSKCLKKAVEHYISKGEKVGYDDVKPFYVMPSQAERDLKNKQ